MATPLEAGDIERFTPPSLDNLPTPPVFLLRAGSRRDRESYQKALLTEGLTRHSPRRIRDEVLVGLKALWDQTTFDTHVERLKEYWEALDVYSKQIEIEPDLVFDYPADEAKAIEGLIARVTEEWPPLRKLGADNVMFAARAPEVMIAILLAGWEGLDLSYRRVAGAVPLDLLEELESELGEVERKHAKVAGVGEPGTAFLELCAAAGRRLFLSKEEEKNSASPAPSSATRPASKTAGKGKGRGRSKGSANSSKTPATA